MEEVYQSKGAILFRTGVGPKTREVIAPGSVRVAPEMGNGDKALWRISAVSPLDDTLRWALKTILFGDMHVKIYIMVGAGAHLTRVVQVSKGIQISVHEVSGRTRWCLSALGSQPMSGNAAMRAVIVQMTPVA